MSHPIASSREVVSASSVVVSVGIGTSEEESFVADVDDATEVEELVDDESVGGEAGLVTGEEAIVDGVVGRFPTTVTLGIDFQPL